MWVVCSRKITFGSWGFASINFSCLFWFVRTSGNVLIHGYAALADLETRQYCFELCGGDDSWVWFEVA